MLVQERKISKELKKLEKGKVEKLDQELAKSKETTCSLKSSIGALQGQHDILLKTHQDLEVQFDALWVSTSKLQAHLKLLKPPLAMIVKDAIILILMLFVLKANIPILSECL